MGRQPRQRPVSCIFCRARKLRCSRQFPCANCTSRGVTCEIEKGGVVPQVVGVGNQTESAGSTGLGGDAVLQLLSRLDKLEKTVQSQHEELKKTREAVFQDESPKGASPRSRRLSSLPQPGTGSRSEVCLVCWWLGLLCSDCHSSVGVTLIVEDSWLILLRTMPTPVTPRSSTASSLRVDPMAKCQARHIFRSSQRTLCGLSPGVHPP